MNGFSWYGISMPEKKRARGRPPLPDGLERGAMLTLRLTAAERARVELEAAKAGKTVSEWVRARVLGSRRR